MKIEEINALSGDSEEGDILLNSSLELSQFVTTNDIAVQDWIMDSRASLNVTPCFQWFTSYDAKRIGRVHLGNNDFTCAIKGVGDVKLKFQHGSTFILKNVEHVPKLTKILITSR